MTPEGLWTPGKKFFSIPKRVVPVMATWSPEMLALGITHTLEELHRQIEFCQSVSFEYERQKLIGLATGMRSRTDVTKFGHDTFDLSDYVDDYGRNLGDEDYDNEDDEEITAAMIPRPQLVSRQCHSRSGPNRKNS